jgi:hypothetical protein
MCPSFKDHFLSTPCPTLRYDSQLVHRGSTVASWCEGSVSAPLAGNGVSAVRLQLTAMKKWRIVRLGFGTS